MVNILTKGIDVSKHNGIIDWSKAKKDIDFAIIRAGYGRLASQKDIKFEKNYQGCVDNNISKGAYCSASCLLVFICHNCKRYPNRS